MKPLRLALIGAGHLGRFHARLASQLAEVQLVGVADINQEARERVAAEALTEPIADYRELIGKIDAAVIATPTSLHHAIGMELADHRIHLLVEKPLAISRDEADALVQIAKRRGVVLQVGHVERFNPALTAVSSHLDEPKYIEAVRTSGYPFRSTDIGVVMDLMIHDLDIALSLARSPICGVEALGVSVMGRHEDAAQARVVFASGCVANFTASRISYVARRQMQIWTPNGFASIDFATGQATLVHPSEAVVHRQFEADTLSTQEQSHLKQHLFDEVLAKETIDVAQTNAIADEQQDFVESIRSKRNPRVSGEQGRDALALAEQILRKIEEHQWDGNAGGRVGPRAMSTAAILRGPHWNLTEPPDAQHREAG